MIDIWLIFAQIVPFVQVILFTVKDNIDTKLGHIRKEQSECLGKGKINSNYQYTIGGQKSSTSIVI